MEGWKGWERWQSTGNKFKEEFNTKKPTVYPDYRLPSLNRAIAPRSAISALA